MCTIVLRKRGWKLEGVGRGLVFFFVIFRQETATDSYENLNILILNLYIQRKNTG